MPHTVSYKWEPIQDYQVDPRTLAKPELRTLAEIWEEQRQALRDSEVLQAFNERLRREWAIETGLLERIYTLDRGVTQILIERGIDASHVSDQGGGQDPERVVAIIRDHEDAMEGLFAFIKGERALSPGYIKELHAQITRHQETTTAVDTHGRLVEIPLLHGAYKTQANNPMRSNGSIHQYAPPEHVASEIEKLVELHASHSGVSPEVEAAWLHHRFTQIHPFQDGNGRVARCLATLVFIRTGYFPLVIRDTREERGRYLDALEAADRGNLEALVAVFAASQRRAFVQALGISGQVLQLTQAEQVVVAARDRLARRELARRADWEKAKATARALQQVATRRLQDIAGRLSAETSSFFRNPRYFVDEEADGGSRDFYFRRQIVEAAKQLDYFANTTDYRAWTRLVVRADSQAEILISFHGAGREFRGVLAASACYFRREETDPGKSEIAEVTPLSDEIFQVNYLEPPQEAEARFREWLEKVLVKGLGLWQAAL